MIGRIVRLSQILIHRWLAGDYSPARHVVYDRPHGVMVISHAIINRPVPTGVKKSSSKSSLFVRQHSWVKENLRKRRRRAERG